MAYNASGEESRHGTGPVSMRTQSKKTKDKDGLSTKRDLGRLRRWLSPKGPLTAETVGSKMSDIDSPY